MAPYRYFTCSEGHVESLIKCKPATHIPKTEEPISAVPDEIIMNQIYYVRGQKVMIDSDLAELYQVKTKQLKRQARRNEERFP